jgi:uncharacterized membrane protein HdeD (DUF308 family)
MTVMRDSMWGFLMFAGVAWLAIAWSVLRLEPAGVAEIAGPVVLFGALCETVRALAGTRTWWLNAGMAVLFAATGAVLLTDPGSSYATPASLVGWFLMVRGALDIAVSTMNRGSDRTWGVLMALGVAQAGLGFYAAGPLARTADPMILLLGGLGMLRAVADLVTALRLREVSGVRHDILQLSPEREAGVAGYSAGRTDFEDAPQPGRARHRAGAAGPKTFHDEVLRTTAELDIMLAQAGVSGTPGTTQRISDADIPNIPDTAEGAHEAAVSEEKP